MKRGRALVIAMLIASLLLTGLVQSFTAAQRRKLLRSGVGGSGPSLATMDSYALALLLGGLRGPLVMFLWMQSENQKSAKNLEGVETQIEWIRLLQPEFDTVHLFQIWNKAYNLSVQMASLSNKYTTILDAIEYARNVEKQRPDNINILMAIANILHDKFANSHEKHYYAPRVRQDTGYRPPQPGRIKGARPTNYDSLLTPDGMIRPELLAPRFHRPATTQERQQPFYDGSELQYLAEFQPFAYGISPFGLAYNYLKRSQALMVTTGQHHLQVSDMVVHSRPALVLKNWSYDEWDRAVQAEGRLLNRRLPSERFDAIVATAELTAGSTPDSLSPQQQAAWDEALFQYDMALKIVDQAEREFHYHLSMPAYTMHEQMYRSHLEDLQGAKTLLSGDRAYLKAMRAEENQRQELLDEARQFYQRATRLYRIVRLRYFVTDILYPQILPKNVDRWQLEQLSDRQLNDVEAKLDAANAQQGYDQYSDDVREYQSYITRAQVRLDLINALEHQIEKVARRM